MPALGYIKRCFKISAWTFAKVLDARRRDAEFSNTISPDSDFGIRGRRVSSLPAGQAAALDLVGYVPNYRMTSTNYVNNILPRQIALLDEVRYFGITVNSNGSGALTTNATHLANIQKLKSLIDAIPEPNRPRLDITLGGWQMSDGFAAIAGDAAKRDALAQNIAALLDQTGATAVDLDWEHPVGGTQLNNYATTLQRIKQEVGNERHVYGTVEPTKFLPASVFTGPNAIDGTSLMTYDLGWWANDGADTNRGEHALPQYAADALSAWTDPPGTSNKRPYVFASWGKGLPEGSARHRLAVLRTDDRHEPVAAIRQRSFVRRPGDRWPKLSAR